MPNLYQQICSVTAEGQGAKAKEGLQFCEVYHLKKWFWLGQRLKMATTIDGLWSDLPEKLQKWKNKSFPYYDDLHDIYNGKLAEGKHCRRSSEKANKTEKLLEEEYGQMSTPSPTLPVMQGPFVDLVQEGIDLNFESGFSLDINDSQYRAMTEEEFDREEQCYNQTQSDMLDLQESQKRKVGAASASTEIPVRQFDMLDLQESQKRKVGAASASTEMPVRQEREKKKSKKSDNAMTELIALCKEELEAYKELTERQLQLNSKQIDQTNPINDPYSMTKCMDKLNGLSLPLEHVLKAINFLKGDREAREIFMSCHKKSLADAYIKGLISN